MEKCSIKKLRFSWDRASSPKADMSTVLPSSVISGVPKMTRWVHWSKKMSMKLFWSKGQALVSSTSNTPSSKHSPRGQRKSSSSHKRSMCAWHSGYGSVTTEASAQNDLKTFPNCLAQCHDIGGAGGTAGTTVRLLTTSDRFLFLEGPRPHGRSFESKHGGNPAERVLRRRGRSVGMRAPTSTSACAEPAALTAARAQPLGRPSALASSPAWPA
mmetsp:Transcript_58506/g.164014  ORF Transcript_58506/g.164014 Transcript_58506/m.164014 type:complete len:214 (+) Transcript_58506:514-1155(+)